MPPVAALENDTTVAVLERHTILGRGATAPMGGARPTVGLKAPTQQIFRSYGEKLGRAFWQASLDAIDLIEDLSRAKGLIATLSGVVMWNWLINPAILLNMKTTVDWYRKALNHQSSHVVSAADLPQEIGTTAYHGGLVDTASAGLHPANMFSVWRSLPPGMGPACVNGWMCNGWKIAHWLPPDN